MGILYLDEAGNTGLNDTNQPFLVYGGPFLTADTWKNVQQDFLQVQKKYFSLVFSRLDQITDPSQIGVAVAQVKFLEQFHFHAAHIINRNGLWSKLSEQANEHFTVLDDILSILLTHQVKFFIGVIKKSSVTGNTKSKPEFKQLLPAFFKHVDTNIDNKHFVVIWDDGDVKEREFILDAMQRPDLNNCMPELVPAKQLPFLQIADIGIWVVQAYHKLPAHRTDPYAASVRQLYQKFEPVLHQLKIGF